MTDLFVPVPPLRTDLFGVDRLVALEARRAEAVRNIPATLGVFDSHFPRLAVLPGVIVLGCLSRLCELLLADAIPGQWSMTSATRVRYRHFVRPGDELTLTVELVEATPDRAVCTGRAAVDGRPVTTARTLVLTPRVGGRS